MTPEDLKDLWNELVGERLPKCLSLELQGRRALAQHRLKEAPDAKRWAAAIVRMTRSGFLTGLKTDGGWRASFDWLLKPGNLTRIEEGNYDDPKEHTPPEAADRSPADLSYFNERPTGYGLGKPRFGLSEEEFKEAEAAGRDPGQVLQFDRARRDSLARQAQCVADRANAVDRDAARSK